MRKWRAIFLFSHFKIYFLILINYQQITFGPVDQMENQPFEVDWIESSTEQNHKQHLIEHLFSMLNFRHQCRVFPLRESHIWIGHGHVPLEWFLTVSNKWNLEIKFDFIFIYQRKPSAWHRLNIERGSRFCLFC